MTDKDNKETLKKLGVLLQSAGKEPKRDFNVYNAYRNQLDDLFLEQSLYDTVITELCKILNI